MSSVTIRVADAMRVSGFVDNDAPARSAKERLAQAIAAFAASPLAVPIAPMESINASVWLSAPQCEALTRWASKFDLSVGEAASAMLIHAFRGWQAQQAAPAAVEPDEAAAGAVRLEHRLSQCGLSARPEQRALYRTFEALDGGNDRRVLMAEAGTGTGKTIAYLSYALDCLECNPLARVYVALPTFALMSQVRAEIGRINGQNPLKILYLMGQSEWVSEVALRELLERAQRGEYAISEDLLPRLHALMAQWLRGISASGKARPWSMADLELAVPDWAFYSEVALSGIHAVDDMEDAGRHAYRQQFANMTDASLIVLTHAMLAHLLKRRFIAALKASKGNEDIKSFVQSWSRTPVALREGDFFSEINAIVCDIVSNDEDVNVLLPDADLLIIDEAHAFKDAVTQAFETHESMYALLLQARQLSQEHPNVFPRDSTDALSALLQEMKSLCGDADVVEVGAAMLARVAQSIEQALTAKKSASKLAKAMALKSWRARKLANLARVVEVFASNASKAQYLQVLLHWSPKRDFPRLSLGARSIRRECNFLWTNFARRSLLISGTLYEENPLPTCEAARNQLAIPRDMLRTMAPIHAQWQIDPVTVFTVALMQDLDGRTRFCRPLSKAISETSQYSHDMAGWIDDVVDYVQRVRKTAVGGVLVVGTAYADIAAIAARVALADPAAPLLVQRQGVSLAGLRQQFLAASAQASKPTLFGVGGVWTGFDLHDPFNQDALTDLVILNLPFGMRGQSVAALVNRLEERSHYELASHALILFRQVVGRLVRTEQTPANRRIHLLDARLHHRPEWRGITAPIRRFLARYRQVVVG